MKKPTEIFPATIVIDRREQTPFAFTGIKTDAKAKSPFWVIPTRTGTLSTGDYSLEGLQSVVAVERKSKADLFGTLGQGRARFVRELERLAEFRFARVVVECELSEIFTNPPPFSNLLPKTVYRSIVAWQARYPNIHWQMCPSRNFAERDTFRYLLRVWIELEEEKQP